jgi:hypothetical protein
LIRSSRISIAIAVCALYGSVQLMASPPSFCRQRLPEPRKIAARLPIQDVNSPYFSVYAACTRFFYKENLHFFRLFLAASWIIVIFTIIVAFP